MNVSFFRALAAIQNPKHLIVLFEMKHSLHYGDMHFLTSRLSIFDLTEVPEDSLAMAILRHHRYGMMTAFLDPTRSNLEVKEQ
jgi:hypothetical protein